MMASADHLMVDRCSRTTIRNPIPIKPQKNINSHSELGKLRTDNNIPTNAVNNINNTNWFNSKCLNCLLESSSKPSSFQVLYKIITILITGPSTPLVHGSN
jgi:hypothetical protein